MIELKYRITDADIKAEDKRTSLEFFAVYCSIGLIGVAVGVVAVVLRPSTALFVLGIIMLVLAGLLSVISIMLVIPHNPAIKSVVLPSDDERTVRLGEHDVSVLDADGELVVSYGYSRFIGMKKRAGYIRLTVERNHVLLIKTENAEQNEQVYALILEKLGKKSKKQNTASAVSPVEHADRIDNVEPEQTDTENTEQEK